MSSVCTRCFYRYLYYHSSPYVIPDILSKLCCILCLEVCEHTVPYFDRKFCSCSWTNQESISTKTIACRELSRIYLANLQHGPFYVTKFRIGKPKCLWNVNDILGMILGKGVALCHRSSDALKLSLINIQSRLISILLIRFTENF